jgi:organic hydroperoxide reductase OsmC/OhrA
MRAILPTIHLTTEAWDTHLAWTEAGAEAAGVVRLGLDGHGAAYPLQDMTGDRPDDLLCAAVAASLDSTIRRIAAGMNLAIQRLAVLVTGDVDARGALDEPGVPVGFQSMRVEVQIRLAGGGVGPAARAVSAAERQCVTLQTLRACVPIDVVITDATAAEPRR